MSKYAVLKELVQAWINQEKENMQEAKSAGINSPAFCMAIGAHDAYKQVLSDIAALEAEVGITE